LTGGKIPAASKRDRNRKQKGGKNEMICLRATQRIGGKKVFFDTTKRVQLKKTEAGQKCQTGETETEQTKGRARRRAEGHRSPTQGGGRGGGKTSLKKNVGG